MPSFLSPFHAIPFCHKTDKQIRKRKDKLEVWNSEGQEGRKQIEEKVSPLTCLAEKMVDKDSRNEEDGGILGYQRQKEV